MQLSSFRLQTKIILVAAVPFVLSVVLAAYVVLDKWNTRAEMQNLTHLAEGTASISRFVHELQRERGASAVFVGSKGAQLQAEVPAQRKRTDEQRRQALEFVSELGQRAREATARAAAEAAEKAVANLDDKRSQISGISITAAESNAYFTDTIARLLTVVSELPKASSRGDISNAISGYVAFMSGKERAGQERATGADGISAGRFDQAGYVRVLGLVAAQQSYFDLFDAAATPGQRDYFKTTVSGPIADRVSAMRQAIANGGLSGNMGGLQGKDWYNATTARIDLLKKVEDGIAADLNAATGAIAAEATRDLMVLAGVLALLLLLSGVAILVVARDLTRPIWALTKGMLKLADGNFDVVLPGLGRKDEIGDIAGAVETFKVKAAEKARLEAEAKAEQDRHALAEKAERDRIAAEEKAAADKRAQAEREVATAKVMNEFDAAVGGIVKAAMGGDFSQRVPLEGKEGVIRNLAGALNSMCETMGSVMEDMVRMMAALAEGDLTRRITADYHGTFATLRDSANTTAERLSQIVADIKTAATEVANAAGEISTSTTDLSQRTEEQAASLEETSASMEEIAATVKKNAENAQQANQLTAGTREVADRGGQVVANAVSAMSRIEESSQKISDIIGVIDEIARQTNLLALNAAVEAARAGDAGRGFAVVASEVRSLAQRSSQAAKDIKDLITNSNTQVKDGVDLVNRAGTSLSEIVESIKSVAQIVADIANASMEQATGIEQVNKALTQMDEVTQQNSALVEENAATAKTLETQSGAMNERVSFFHLQDDGGVVRMPARPAADPAKPAALAAAKYAARHAASPAAKRGGIVGRMQTALATALKQDPELEEF